LTKKEIYRWKQKLGKVRETVMLLLMLIAGGAYALSGYGETTGELTLFRESEIACRAEEKEASEQAQKGQSAASEQKTKETHAVSGEDTVTADSITNNPRDNGKPTDAGKSSGTEKRADRETASTERKENNNKINLNTATLEELDSLPGIGPATAQKIIEYRETWGGFAVPEEILNVKRIGEKTYEKLKDKITV
jgi:comEA protein